MMYGMPFPGDYLVAPDRTVRDKLFLPSYEHRPSASQVVLKHFSGETGGNSIDIKTDALTATVSLSTDRCFPGQELAVSLRIRLKPGWHIYGKPLPGNYQPTELLFDGPMVGEQSLEFPPPSPMLLKALGETLPVYRGEIRASASLGSSGVRQLRQNSSNRSVSGSNRDSTRSAACFASRLAATRSVKCRRRSNSSCR